MKRSTGYLIGNGLYITSAACVAAIALFPKIRQRNWIGFAAAGLTSLGVGYYFKSALYLDDPEALAEYRAEITRSPLSAALQKYDVTSLLKICDFMTVRSMYEKEMGSLPLSAVISKYSFRIVLQLLQSGVLELPELQKRYDTECDKASNFTDLWHGLAGQMPELHSHGIMNVNRSQQLFFAEFSYVDGSGAYKSESSSSAEAAEKAGSPIGLLRAINQYSSFAKKTFSVTDAFFKGVVENSAYARRATLRELVADGLLNLHKNNFVGPDFVLQKWKEYIGDDADDEEENNKKKPQQSESDNNNNNNKEKYESSSSPKKPSSPTAAGANKVTLWRAETEVRVKDLLRANLIPASEVQGLFKDAIPLRLKKASSGDAFTKENHIVLFCDYWDDILKAYPEVVPLIMRSIVNRYWRQGSGVDKTLQAAKTSAETRREHRAGKKLDDEIAKITTLKHPTRYDMDKKKELQADKERAESEYKRDLTRAKEDWDRDMADLQRDFASEVYDATRGQF